MSLLRVSSYRRLFEEEEWGSGPAASLQCGGQYRVAARAGRGVELVEPDFAAARTLNREGLSSCVRDRGLIAALNNRLVNLIETAHCLEEENQMLEAEILELERRLESRTSPSSTSQRENILDLSAVVERLRKEKEEILSDIDARQKQLLILQENLGHTSEQRALLELQREEIAPEVDAVTAECLALQEQVGIYEEQLELMQEEHEQRVETLVAPSDGAPLVSLAFPTPDVIPTVLDIKEYYRELAENLQFEPAAITWDEETKKPKAGTEFGVEGRSVSDVGELKKRIAELEKELEALRQCGEALEREIEDKEVLHEEEIAHLEDCAAELQESHNVLQQEIKEQADDYEELLSEKMALDIEIAAYRGLVEEEVERLCYY
ncbi:alpha-internexin-like [Acipenser ruthenus]|uniref:alpha-internexin-like n=1 Tax=Acipenser ruthenus TaxID=7906 RepID=UPI002740D887|nr:alpha-internexin-like [Acipenser ruthenus]XP_058845352.1 alpha-internexin-like [Acipenser ruthenus]